MNIRTILLALVANLAASSVADAVTLTYAGTNFSSFEASGPTPPSDPYTTADSITGSVQLAAPLAPNLSFAEVRPMSFSFSDGVNTLTNADATGTSFYFSTNGSGEIVEWLIEVTVWAAVQGGGTLASIETFKYFDSGTPVAAEVVLDVLCGPGSNPNSCELSGDPFYRQVARTQSSPGAWTSAVPLPAALPLFLTALAGLGAAVRTRRRVAAPA
jgi:hypothetical protein